MKKTKKILGILLSLALLLNFVPLTALAEPDPGSPEAIYATVELQVGWYADGVFTPLAQGETIDQGEILTVRVLPRSNYLVGPSCYPLMFDSTAFAFVGTPSDRNSFLVNSANYYYNQTCVSYASSQIPTRAWPTGIVPADQMANYTAVKVNFQANTNSANGGYPNVLDGTWLFQFGLQATKNIVYGTNARIWTHETWFRDPSRPSAQGYIPKVLEGQLSSSGSNNYYFDYDFSQNSDYLLATEPMAQSTITFDTAGGNEINPITGNVGDPVTAPADPVKEGFTFLGWDPQIPDTFPADDLTVIAQWNLNSYNLTFDANGGEGGTGPTPTEFGAAITAPVVTKEGHTFVAWEPAVPPTMPAADSVYKATWQVNSYNLTFDADGGEGGTGPTPTEFGTAITAPVVTKEGHTFVAWEPAVPPTMPAADSVYKATWQVNSYNLTFDADGGEGGTGPTPTEFGTAITAPVVTKEGHTFLGWEPAVPPTMPAADSVYKATWQVNSYNLTFDADGGEGGTGPTPTEFGTAITAPVVTKEGYTFLGWEPAVPPTMPAADSVYKATWQINQYTVSFDSNGGSDVDSITQDYGTAITAPAEPTKEGFTFIGWQPEVPATMPAENTECVAQWEAIPTSTITFDTAGGNEIDPITGYVGTPVTAPADPVKDGFNFIGWDPQIPATFPEDDLTVVAQWEAVPVPQSTITFDTAGGNEIDPITGNVGDPVTAPADPVKDGFNFIGWDPQIPATFPEDDLTVVAQWEAVPVPQSTITFDTAGGNEIDPITGNVGDPVTAPADPVKDGFNFIGWDPQIPATFPEDDLTVVAQWEAVPVPQSTITFDTAGGNEIDPITGNVGDSVTAPADPVKDGFNFIGWDPQIPATFPEDDLTVVAQWEAVPVPQSTITFDTDGGNEIDPITGNVGDPVTAPADPVKDGFNFMGWEPRIPDTFPADDLTVVAQWEEDYIPQSTITFDTDGGNEIDPITGNVGDPVTAPADPVKDGFNFMGWEPRIPDTFPEDDLTVVAQWEEIPAPPQSTITFDTAGGNEIDPITGEVGSPVTAPADPVKDGFNFMGWEPRIPDTFPEDDLTVVAQWEEIPAPPQSTITFDTAGGNEIDPITGNVGDPVTAPADPVKDGFNFMGWEPQIPDTFPEDDLTVVAQWEEIPAPPQSTITFDTAGGNEIDPITGEVGSPVTAPADPVKDGFNFMGWEPQIPATFPADDLTVVAQWEEKPVLQVKITFLVDGMEYDVLEGDSGTAVTPPANPTKSGYVFAGWSPAVPANFPDEDLTVEAQWILLGDVNNDGVVNSYDALAVLRHSTGEALLDEPYATAGDVNGDGKLSSLDALMILHYVSGKLPEFPAA